MKPYQWLISFASSLFVCVVVIALPQSYAQLSEVSESSKELIESNVEEESTEAEKTAPLSAGESAEEFMGQNEAEDSEQQDFYILKQKQAYQRILEMELDKFDLMIKELIIIGNEMQPYLGYDISSDVQKLYAINRQVKTLLEEMMLAELSDWPQLKDETDDIVEIFEEAYDRINDRLTNLIGEKIAPAIAAQDPPADV